MSRSQKQAGLYLLIPCLFLAVLFGGYKIAGVSIENYVISQLYMAMEKGSPDYRRGSSDAKPEDAAEPTERIKESEISYPAVGERYGRISCEEIGLDVFLYFGDDEEILKHGVGQYADSSLPGFGGTVLVCGHDTTYLSSLREIKNGMVITLDTQYGTYQYSVRETKVVTMEDSAACELTAKAEQLVLYTSYPFGAIWKARDERFFVYCDKIAGAKVEIE